MDAPPAPQPQPSTTFHLFANLPAELQHLIWKYAYVPRIVKLQPSLNSEYLPDPTDMDRPPRYRNRHITCQRLTSLPAEPSPLLLACKGARYITLKELSTVGLRRHWHRVTATSSGQEGPAFQDGLETQKHPTLQEVLDLGKWLKIKKGNAISDRLLVSEPKDWESPKGINILIEPFKVRSLPFNFRRDLLHIPSCEADGIFLWTFRWVDSSYRDNLRYLAIEYKTKHALRYKSKIETKEDFRIYMPVHCVPFLFTIFSKHNMS